MLATVSCVDSTKHVEARDGVWITSSLGGTSAVFIADRETRNCQRYRVAPPQRDSRNLGHVLKQLQRIVLHIVEDTRTT